MELLLAIVLLPRYKLSRRQNEYLFYFFYGLSLLRISYGKGVGESSLPYVMARIPDFVLYVAYKREYY